MVHKLHLIFFLIILGCSTKMVGNKNESLKDDKSEKNVFLQDNYQKMIIGAWELDSLSINGVINRNGQWVEIFNSDYTYCFFSDKKYGNICEAPLSGDLVKFGMQNDTLYQYRIWITKKQVFPKEKFRKIIKLTDSILVYRSIGLDKDQVYYYHRIR